MCKANGQGEVGLAGGPSSVGRGYFMFAITARTLSLRYLYADVIVTRAANSTPIASVLTGESRTRSHMCIA